MNDLLINNPEACRPLFVKGGCEDVDAKYLISCLEAEFSNPGTPERAVKEHIFQDFLDWVEDEQVTGYVYKSAIAWDYGVERSGEEDNGVDGEKYSTPDLITVGVMQ